MSQLLVEQPQPALVTDVKPINEAKRKADEVIVIDETTAEPESKKQKTEYKISFCSEDKDLIDKVIECMTERISALPTSNSCQGICNIAIFQQVIPEESPLFNLLDMKSSEMALIKELHLKCGSDPVYLTKDTSKGAPSIRADMLFRYIENTWKDTLEYIESPLQEPKGRYKTRIEKQNQEKLEQIEALKIVNKVYNCAGFFLSDHVTHYTTCADFSNDEDSDCENEEEEGEEKTKKNNNRLQVMPADLPPHQTYVYFHEF